MTQLNTSDEIHAILQQGNAALRAGDAVEARKYFRRATEVDPDNIDAWLGMASAVRPFREKYEHLQRAKTIDPTHPDVLASLAYVEARLGAGEVLAAPIRADDDGDAPDTMAGAAPEVETLYCYRHPNRETGLRCVQCGNPICTECIRPAFVGQLCPDCALERRPRNYQVEPKHLTTAAGVTLGVSGVVSMLVNVFLGGFGFFSFIIAFLVAPFAAEMIVRLLDRITHAKRGKEMQLVCGVSYGAGVLLSVMMFLLVLGIPLQLAFSFISLPLILFSVIAIVTLVGRLR